MGKSPSPGSRKKVPGKSARVRPSETAGASWREAVGREFERAERLFVLGIGNPDRADDGAGLLCARILREELGRAKKRKGRSALKKVPLQPIEVLEAGEAPENAMGIIRRFRPTHVLIIDASLGGREPGEIFLVERRKIRREDLSTHRIPLTHLIRYLEQSVKCRVIVVGIEPQLVAWNRPTSRVTKKAAMKLARDILRLWKKNIKNAPCLQPVRAGEKRSLLLYKASKTKRR